jgi:hypothetical protein
MKGEEMEWYHSLKHSNGLDWEYFRKAFYVKYYSPYKAYCEHSYIYNFWLHSRESIAQACERLTGLLLKSKPWSSERYHIDKPICRITSMT